MHRLLPPPRQAAALRAMLNSGHSVRVVESHSAISCMVASRASVNVCGTQREFDAIWVSSLTSSAVRGIPDMEMYLFESRMETIREIIDATDKPVLVDGDTGGEAGAFEYLCRRLERASAGGVVIEDKRFPKRNSLSGESAQELEDIEVFSRKIKRGKAACQTEDFLVVARLEGFIAGAGIDEVVRRALHYSEAGADAILVHSRQRSPEQVLEFASRYRAAVPEGAVAKPLFCIPTTYNSISAEQLFENGFSGVIHANHLLRAAHRAMRDVAASLLTEDRSMEADAFCSTITDLFEETGYTAAIERNQREISV
jgi:phosphoenolpyruvate mutase